MQEPFSNGIKFLDHVHEDSFAQFMNIRMNLAMLNQGLEQLKDMIVDS